MVTWIRIAAWVIIAFAVPGLVYSVVTVDWQGALLNMAFLIVGILDVKNLKLAALDPVRGWRRIIWTQGALGFLIWISMMTFARFAIESDYWDHSREILEQVRGERIPEFLWRDTLARSKAILKWGSMVGGFIVLVAQFNVCWKLHKLSRSSNPPPLPGES